MWVSTSFSWALNFSPHQVRSAFQLSICPPSSRMKRKFPCSAHGGTSSGLARYSFGDGRKVWAKQSSRDAATKPISPMLFTTRTRCMVLFLRYDQVHYAGDIALNLQGDLQCSGRDSQSAPFPSVFRRVGRFSGLIIRILVEGFTIRLKHADAGSFRLFDN